MARQTSLCRYVKTPSVYYNFFLKYFSEAASSLGKYPPLFTSTSVNNSQFCSQIRNSSQLWNWFDEVLIPATFAGEWYNGRKETTTEYTGNKRSILVGMPLLRQLRVSKGTKCFAFLQVIFTILPKECILNRYSTCARCISGNKPRPDLAITPHISGFSWLS